MTFPDLTGLGWSDHFARQLHVAETGAPARITAVHRDRLAALSPQGALMLLPAGPVADYAVGDWVLHDGQRVSRLLERASLIARRGAGTVAHRQAIAANVDTLGIVTSCNADFNPARMNRYLVLAASAGVLPLVILTKADQVPDDRPFRRQAEALSPLVTAIALDARDPVDVARLAPWCRDGQTLALVGSSGVGKTTIQNALTGTEEATRTIREDDAKGRHTTTARHLRQTRFGGWLIDTPGMRELGLAEAAEGIATVFADVEALAGACRFSDCAHETEPGCAVRAAIEDGTLAAERLAQWRKLQREDQIASQSVAEARARDRALGRLYEQGKKHARRKRAVD